MKKLFLLLLAAPCLCVSTINAQGCSDGGFCSLNYHTQTGKQFGSSIAIGNVSGQADGGTFVNSTYITYSTKLNNLLYWDAKITLNYACGSLANNLNAGDIFTNLTWQAYSNDTKKQALKLLGGVKLPLTAANDKAGGKPLPMAYQASLGTWDALLGINYTVHNWEFTNAYEAPLTRQNKNTFIKEYSVSGEFPSTNKFRRRADVLLRAAYNIKKQGKNLWLKPNILAIYHAGEDSFEDIYGMRRKLNGSNGLTLNANIIAGLALGKRTTLEVSAAAPFVVREIRPDGLTREFTFGVDYKVGF